MQANPGAEWLIWVFIGLGPLLIAVGWWLRRGSRWLIRHGIETAGTYVDTVSRSSLGSAPGTTTRYGVIEYRGPDGERREHRGMIGVPWAGRWKGKAVVLLVDPRDPDRARIKSFAELWLPALIFIGVGVSFLIGGILSKLLLL